MMKKVIKKSIIFLFDNGDTNMIASMLRYAETHQRDTLESLDFCIVFMGASVEAMVREPFCRHPDKLLHYKQLGIAENIDNTWKRNQKIDLTNLSKIGSALQPQKKVWVAVSNLVLGQIAEMYQSNEKIEVVAFRDNPNSHGCTDYFPIADEVQNLVDKIIVPSRYNEEPFKANRKNVIVVGHGPTEEWQAAAERLNKEALMHRLGFDPHLPVLVYAGSYGETYANAFQLFLDMLKDENLASHPIQVLIVPHPRYKGMVEKKLTENMSHQATQLLIGGEFEEDPALHVRTMEALAIADAVVTADATSTIVLQASALKKPVLYISQKDTLSSETLRKKKLIDKIALSSDLIRKVEAIHAQREAGEPLSVPDIFQLLSMPKEGARLLWEEFIV